MSVNHSGEIHVQYMYLAFVSTNHHMKGYFWQEKYVWRSELHISIKPYLKTPKDFYHKLHTGPDV